MRVFKVILIFLAVLIGLLALSWGFGWFGVFTTATVGKAQQAAERKVYEETPSYVMAKRQQALKYYNEYIETKDEQTKQILKHNVAQMFAEFDETKHLSGTSERFVHWCKYGTTKDFDTGIGGY